MLRTCLTYRIFDSVRTSATISMQRQLVAQDVQSGRIPNLIQDYSNWNDNHTFQKPLSKLVEGLNLFDK